MMIKREKGTIKHFNKAKGFGFIQGDNTRDIIYFNSKDIHSDIKLSSGQRVEFILSKEEKQWRASDLIIEDKQLAKP